MKELYKPYDEKMGKTIESVKSDFASVRAGRANPGVLDGIPVDPMGIRRIGLLVIWVFSQKSSREMESSPI